MPNPGEGQRAKVQPLSAEDLLRILNHDRIGHFAKTTIYAMTKQGTIYSLNIRPGRPVSGGLDGKRVTFRNVDCARIVRGGVEWTEENQFVHFDGKRLSIYSEVPPLPVFGQVPANAGERDEAWVSTSTLVVVSTLVIDWNKTWM